MSIHSDQLTAFSTLARLAHFSRAAEELGITQSALSLRIKKLEESLATTLFIRARSGALLTESGQELLRYASLKATLETEVSARISGDLRGSTRQGTIRVGGYSSIMRSVALKSLGALCKTNPRVFMKLVTRELEELPELLYRGEVDFLILDRKIEREGIEGILLGEEVNVLVRPKSLPFPVDVFLDHDERDQTTFHFLRANKNKSPYRRHYLDDIYGILDGVTLGLGRAVVSRHLLAKQKSIEIDPGFKALRTPVYLHYYEQPYYSQLHDLVKTTITNEFASCMG